MYMYVCNTYSVCISLYFDTFIDSLYIYIYIYFFLKFLDWIVICWLLINEDYTNVKKKDNLYIYDRS